MSKRGKNAKKSAPQKDPVPLTKKKGNTKAKSKEKGIEATQVERKVISITSHQWNGQKNRWEYWTTYSDLTSAMEPRESFVDVDPTTGEETFTKCFHDYEAAYPITDAEKKLVQSGAATAAQHLATQLKTKKKGKDKGKETEAELKTQKKKNSPKKNSKKVADFDASKKSKRDDSDGEQKESTKKQKKEVDSVSRWNTDECKGLTRIPSKVNATNLISNTLYTTKFHSDFLSDPDFAHAKSQQAKLMNKIAKFIYKCEDFDQDYEEWEPFLKAAVTNWNSNERNSERTRLTVAAKKCRKDDKTLSPDRILAKFKSDRGYDAVSATYDKWALEKLAEK